MYRPGRVARFEKAHKATEPTPGSVTPRAVQIRADLGDLLRAEQINSYLFASDEFIDAQAASVTRSVFGKVPVSNSQRRGD